MTLRTARERIVQVCAYEIGAFCLAVPLYPLVYGVSFFTGAQLMLIMVFAEAGCGCLHDIAFDLAEWRLARRKADQRPARWRVVHAFSREVALSLVSVPLILVFTGCSLLEALLIDFGLMALYVLYNGLFFRLYDGLRPVRDDHAAVRAPG